MIRIIPPSDIAQVCDELRSQGAKIVFTNGVFDLLHPGHVQFLFDAKELGSHLVVALNTDASTARIKGDKRPVVPLAQRAEILAALEPVDFVTWFEEDTPAEILKLVRPDILVKGGDWDLTQIVGMDFVESYGGMVRVIPFIEGYSTTSIIDKILSI